MSIYHGAAVPLAVGDIASVAAENGWEEAALRAVLDVEARGKGFDGQGRVVCLYEPHIAHRQSKGDVRVALVKAGLAYPEWRRDYPATSYDRVDRCIAIAGEEIAARSTSWGLGQVMGFNHIVVGFPTAVAMVRAFAGGELAQLRGMARFISTDHKMNAALKARDWRGFAARYNGAGYEANSYHTKLAAAYAKHKRVLTAERTTPTAAAPIIKLGATGKAVLDWQRELQAEGFPVAIDGDFGRATDTATRTLQGRLGLTQDGVVGPATRAAVASKRGTAPRPMLKPAASTPLITASAPRLAAPLETTPMSTASTIAAAVAKAVTAAAASPSIAVEMSAVSPVTAAVVKEVSPVVEHLTNQEPWYRSRVTWGAIISALVPILGALGIATDWIKPDEVAALLVAAGAVVGTLVTLYGRWRARKPIGA